MKQIINRLKERSTWLGVTAVISAVGIELAPEIKEQIIVIGIGIAGIISIITKDMELPEISKTKEPIEADTNQQPKPEKKTNVS